MRKQTYRIITGGLAAALVSGLQLPAVTAYASVTNEVQAFRNNVIQLCGITNTEGDLSGIMTRGEFAELLVKASSYKDSAAASNLAAANDVPASNQYAFFSVPYDKSWHATVNGEPVEILKVNGLMAVPVSAGYNFIQFRYSPTPLWIGIGLSIFSLILSLIYVKCRRKASVY